MKPIGTLACKTTPFAGELIRKDGLFVTKDLKPLNPQNLK